LAKPGVNFINILRTSFSYESTFLPPKFRTEAVFWVWNFWRQKFHTKNALNKRWWNWLLPGELLDLNELTSKVISSKFYEQILCTNVFCAPFLYIHFGFEIFRERNISAKSAREMLMKLTTDRPDCWLLNLVWLGKDSWNIRGPP